MIVTNLRNKTWPSYHTSFKHEPLDYRRGAIRLLRILPQLSHNGHIQCEMWHDSVTASYSCLSYVWGSEKIQKQILINGKPRSVRENLYDFMRVARSKYANPPRTLWIDALCIDQDSVLEKNHQVSQMGSIYANAIEVISWLGFSQSIGRAFVFGLQLGIDPAWSYPRPGTLTWEEQREKWLQRNKETNGQLKRDWLTVVHDRYWTRAWITQELLLARQLKFLVNDLEVDPIQISGCALGLIGYINDLPKDVDLGHEKWDIRTRVFHHYIFFIWDEEKSSNKPELIRLFKRLPGRQSYYVHDRVYSLLSLASDASSIKVDYNISRSELLYQVMSIYKTKMCICSWFYMADMLDCYRIPDPKSKDSRLGKTPLFRISAVPIQPEFVMGEDSKNWYYACSQCAKRIDFFDEKTQTTFCIRPLCSKVPGGHLYVHEYKRGKYKIRRNDDTTSYDVAHFQPRNPGSEDDIDLGWGSVPGLYDLYLTGDVLMKLFFFPTQEVRQALPLQICPEALHDDAKMELC